MPVVAEPVSASTGYALQARIDRELRIFPIHDGMIIGSDASCDVVVHDAFPRQVELRWQFDAWRLYPADPEVQIRDSMNRECAWLPLDRERMFVVGATIFEFIAEPIAEAQDPLPPQKIRHTC